MRWNAVVVVQYPSRDARFDRVTRVYRPGVDFMRALVGSSFMAGIIGGKQPDDSLAVLTLPILARLQLRLCRGWQGC